MFQKRVFFDTINPFRTKVEHTVSEMEMKMERVSVQVMNTVELFNTRISRMQEPEDFKDFVMTSNKETIDTCHKNVSSSMAALRTELKNGLLYT